MLHSYSVKLIGHSKVRLMAACLLLSPCPHDTHPTRTQVCVITACARVGKPKDPPSGAKLVGDPIAWDAPPRTTLYAATSGEAGASSAPALHPTRRLPNAGTPCSTARPA